MKIYLFCLLTFISTIIFAEVKFGENVNKKNLLSIVEIVNNSSNYNGQEISIEGIVEKICVKKGCWLNLNAGKETVRVTFKDYGIFVPANFLGKKVVMKGVFNLTEESVERRKHLLEDEGVPRSEIQKIESAQKIFSFVASGIEAI